MEGICMSRTSLDVNLFFNESELKVTEFDKFATLKVGKHPTKCTIFVHSVAEAQALLHAALEVTSFMRKLEDKND